MRMPLSWSSLGRCGGLAIALSLVATPAPADWTFDAPLELTAGAAVFPHLDAAGRRAMAVSAGTVAIAWEDSKDSEPHCRVALRAPDAVGFSVFRVGGEECYAPAIAALDDGRSGVRFGVVWEDEAGVAFARVDSHGLGPALRLAPTGSHASLAWHPRLGLFAAWSAPDGRRARIWRSRLSLAGETYSVGPALPADAAPLVDDQLYPVLAAARDTVSLAWEDRRLGHTVIYVSASPDGDAWTPPARVSRNPTGRAQGTDLGRGTGAMRPALAPFAAGRLAVVWLDKRDFLSGYDVYAALSDNGGRSQGKETKVQDSFGDAIAQWHVAAAGNERGDLIVAWDDERDGSADVWLTWLKADGTFADNLSPPPASGPAGQTDPAVALDESGNLHLAWIERDANGTARLRYSLGRVSAGGR